MMIYLFKKNIKQDFKYLFSDSKYQAQHISASNTYLSYKKYKAQRFV